MNAVWLALSPPSRTQIWADWVATALFWLAIGVLALTWRPQESDQAPEED